MQAPISALGAIIKSYPMFHHIRIILLGVGVYMYQSIIAVYTPRKVVCHSPLSNRISYTGGDSHMADKSKLADCHVIDNGHRCHERKPRRQ